MNETVNPVNIVKGALTLDRLSYMDSLINCLQTKAEKAECVLRDVAENYFSFTPDRLPKAGSWVLHAGYNRGRIQTEIACDYLCGVIKDLEQARKKLNAEYNFCRQGEGPKESATG